jgi:hypothetical protein
VPLFELVIALLLSAWARRISVPYPALLALTGAALALLPDMPSVTLDPELALAASPSPPRQQEASPHGSGVGSANRKTVSRRGKS